jgi:hypothetical protein
VIFNNMREANHFEDSCWACRRRRVRERERKSSNELGWTVFLFACTGFIMHVKNRGPLSHLSPRLVQFCFSNFVGNERLPSSHLLSSQFWFEADNPEVTRKQFCAARFSTVEVHHIDSSDAGWKKTDSRM